MKTRLIEEARAIGFAKAGITRPEACPELPARLSAFVHRGGFALAECRSYSPRDGGDGFFAGLLRRL